MGNNIAGGNFNSIHTPVEYATATNSSKVGWDCVDMHKDEDVSYGTDISPSICARAWRGDTGKVYAETGLKFFGEIGDVTLFKANAASTNKLVTFNAAEVVRISQMSVLPTGKQVVIDKSNPYGAFSDGVDEGPLRAFVYANDIVYYFQPGNPWHVTAAFTGNGGLTEM
jgi:hypothetical protein